MRLRRMRRLGWVLCGLLAWATAASADDDREHLFPAEPDVQIDIELIQGRIEIEGWDEPSVRLRRRGDGALSVDADEDWISITSGRGEGGILGWIRGGQVDLKLDVPRGARIEARTINGDIRAEDVTGVLAFHAANGEIKVEGEPREARMETLASKIEFEGENSSVDARTVSGEIKLEGVGGEVVATTMSGSIKVEADRLERADLRTLSGSIDLEGALEEDARIYARSHSGSIKLVVPEDTVARFDASTASGSIKNDFGDDGQRRRRGQRLDFVTGFAAGGGKPRASVTLETFSGSLKIEAD